eukprot:9382410-Pyramimonas_sp.AAC.1
MPTRSPMRALLRCEGFREHQRASSILDETSEVAHEAFQMLSRRYVVLEAKLNHSVLIPAERTCTGLLED